MNAPLRVPGALAGILRFGVGLAVVGVLIVPQAASAATDIERVVSPLGIEAWLVHETTVPMIAIDFAFRGGSAQDPRDKPGVADMAINLLDEGAGPLDSHAYHEQLEAYAIGLSFSTGRDQVTGSLRTLVEHQDKAFELLRLALASARFESDAVERVRAQVLSGLRRATTNPNDLAGRRWWETAFPDHPYGRPVAGTLESVPRIGAADLKDYVRRVFARDGLKIGIVGNIDADAAGAIVDRIFGGLPAKGELADVPTVDPQGLGRTIHVDLDVAQSVVSLGGVGIPRNDPDFMAGYVLNHILGGGSMSSRLHREVRETRGLAYSVYSSLAPMDHTALFMTGTATRGDRAAEALGIMEAEIRRMAGSGPTEDELADAKSFLKGSFALRFDTSSKIASQLVQLQLEDLGIDYIIKRNGLVDAITLDDTKRVAKRVLDRPMLAVVVGRSAAAVAGGTGEPAPAAAAKRDGGG